MLVLYWKYEYNQFVFEDHNRNILFLGVKGDKNKVKDDENDESEQSESNDSVPSSSKETETGNSISVTPENEPSSSSKDHTHVKSEIDESEFRENVYAIDQCVFVISSSSDEELENNEDVGQDYAKKLSMEERMSQEEILRLIKQQNSAAKKEYPRVVPSTSSMVERPYSDHSDVEDDPDPVAVPSTSGWTSSNRLSPKTSPSVASVAPSIAFTEENENFEKSMTKLDQMINAVRGKESDKPTLLRLETEANVETASIKSLSESDSESGFIEVTEETPKSQYFHESKSQTIEISIDPSKIEDDLFADVFEPISAEECQKSEIETIDIPEESPAMAKRLEEQLRESPAIFESESSLKSADGKMPSEITEAFDNKLKNELKNQETAQVKNLESGEKTQPKPNEVSSQNKSPINAKTKDRVRKIAEIFNRVVSFFKFF